MTTAALATAQSAGGLNGQHVVVIGGSSGIGLETARQARIAGAELIITGRNPVRLDHAVDAVTAIRGPILDLREPAGIEQFFTDLPGRVDHVLVTGGGPIYTTIADMDFDAALGVLNEHLVGALRVARACSARVRPGGSLTFMTGTDARHSAIGSSLAAITAAAVPAIAANIALEFAPMRTNAIAAGYVDTPLSARILGDQLDHRRAELRSSLPIRRIVGPVDIAATAIHLMVNSAITGATFDVDGGQQLIPNG